MSIDGGDRLAATARNFSYVVGPQDPPFSHDIAIEAPIEIAFGGAPFVVMMATPTNLEDLAVGFALTEGIIERYGEVRAIETSTGNGFGKINVSLSGERLRTHLARKRAITGRTGCGVCGVEDLSHLPRGRVAISQREPLPPRSIGNALAMLDALQPLNAATRAVHGAAWCDQEGVVQLVREDVGRHNALDKCIGSLLRDSANPAAGFFLITSRCSFEMVAKASRFGAGTLVSLSAPTSMALQLARECEMTLIVTARTDHATCIEL